MNKDLHLFTISEPKTEIEMEIDVETGRGYVIAEERKDKKSLGEITVDSLFAPIEKVSYVVENTRVGQATTLIKSLFILQQNGSVSPKEAMIDAADIGGTVQPYSWR